MDKSVRARVRGLFGTMHETTAQRLFLQLDIAHSEPRVCRDVHSGRLESGTVVTQDHRLWELAVAFHAGERPAERREDDKAELFGLHYGFFDLHLVHEEAARRRAARGES